MSANVAMFGFRGLEDSNENTNDATEYIADNCISVD